MAMDVVENLRESLQRLHKLSPYVAGSAVVTKDGFVVASDLHSKMDEKKITIMAVAMLTMGKETMDELGTSNVERVLVESEDDYILLVNAGPDAIVAAVADKGAVLGLLLISMKQIAQQVSNILA